ncbi:MAG: MOSC domain-containing protein [Paracoccaceae bacterium]|nr:MOSC domain-containing protein [Paracoccaceae bacterium]
MTGRLASIWRHPIKGHGFESLDAVDVEAGRTLPWDRRWAVTHEAAKADGSEWAPCANFSRGAKAPALMAIGARSDEAAGLVTLTHPERPDLTFNPEEDARAFLDWAAPLMPKDRAASARIVRARRRGMTDTDFPSISLAGAASLRALSGKLGRPLDQRRFRANFWVEGLGPWEEFEWVGKTVTIGSVRFSVRERIERCMATTANPKTGRRDADTLGALEDGWGHRDFGVYLVAETSGRVAMGDAVGAVG